jgi:UDP-N-acetylglucosamine--N-acetylmuramyl-(pentapeptide) pyrophosphoryl-undecaprenol N-acetylglucosamine transferase
MRVVIAGGGTAGHVFPGLAVGRELRARGHEVEFVGTERGLEARLVADAGFDFRPVPARPLKRELSVDTLTAPVVAASAVRACRPIVRDAGAVLGMGGYVSVSSVLAARRERVPVVLHEQNAVPGLANRALGRLARAVALSFADAQDFFARAVRTVVTGNPVRPEILAVPGARDALTLAAARHLGLERDRRTVLVFGGSLGALHLDRATSGAVRLLRDRSDLQVLLITGPDHLETVRRGIPEGAALLVRLVGYLDRMDEAYAVADLVVARAGATTIAELAVCGLPALLIPYPYATGNHQEANARALQRAGGASLLLDDQLDAETLAERVLSLIDHGERLAAMRERSAAFGTADAAQRVADLILEVAAGGRAAA